MKDALTQFEQADWKTIVPLLLKYALLCVRKYEWKTTADSLPEGQGLEDVVYGSIQKTLEQLKTGKTGRGLRTWNPEAVDLLGHLKGVVKSDVNTLVNLEEHRRREYDAEKNEEEQESQDDRWSAQQAKEASYDASAEGAKALYGSLMSQLKSEMESDTLVLKYLLTVEAIIRDGGEVSYETIMMEGGLSSNEVRNSKRKVERAVIRFKGKIYVKGGGK